MKNVVALTKDAWRAVYRVLDHGIYRRERREIAHRCRLLVYNLIEVDGFHRGDWLFVVAELRSAGLDEIADEIVRQVGVTWEVG